MQPILDKKIRCKCGDVDIQDGMFVMQQKKYYLLTNSRDLNGCNAPDKKSYCYSVWIGDEGYNWEKILQNWHITQIRPNKMNHEE